MTNQRNRTIEMSYRGYRLLWSDHGLERAMNDGRQYEEEIADRHRSEFSLRNFVSLISLTKGGEKALGTEPQFIKFIDNLNGTCVVIQYIPLKKIMRIKTCFRTGDYCRFKEHEKNAVLDSEGFRLYAEAEKNEIGEILCEYNFAEKGIRPTFFKAYLV